MKRTASAQIEKIFQRFWSCAIKQDNILEKNLTV
jgi:hypothetical protein